MAIVPGGESTWECSKCVKKRPQELLRFDVAAASNAQQLSINSTDLAICWPSGFKEMHWQDASAT
jgi:hypothetical protein